MPRPPPRSGPIIWVAHARDVMDVPVDLTGPDPNGLKEWWCRLKRAAVATAIRHHPGQRTVTARSALDTTRTVKIWFKCRGRTMVVFAIEAIPPGSRRFDDPLRHIP